LKFRYLVENLFISVANLRNCVKYDFDR